MSTVAETPVADVAVAAVVETPAVEAAELVIPDVIERLPKPDKAAHDASIASLDKEIKALQARTNVVRAEMDALKTGRGGYGEQIQAAKAVYNQLRAQKDNLIQERNQITASVKSVLEKKDATIKTQRSQRAGLRFQTVDEYEKEIASLRHEQETRSMTLPEEKKIVKEIEALQVQKQQVSKVGDNKGEVEKHNDTIKDIRARQTKKNADIDAVQEKLAAQKLVLDDLYQKNDEERKQDKFPALAKERKEIKEKLDKLFGQLKEQRAAFKVANDKYYENIRLVRKKKELERKAEDERRRAEYEAKLAEYETEMAKLHPYQTEMDLCDALVAFIENTFAKELKEGQSEAGEATDAAKAAAATKELDGLKPLQRKEEEFMSFGGGKKKKGKKEGSAKKSKRDAKLSLPLAQLESFSTVGLLPPSNVAALPDSLKAIKAKKVEFTGMTSRPKADKPVEEKTSSPTEAPAKASSPVKKNKNNKKFNAADKNAFPTLGGGEPAPASPTAFGVAGWGPGMAPPPSAFGADAFIAQATEETEDADIDN